MVCGDLQPATSTMDRFEKPFNNPRALTSLQKVVLFNLILVRITNKPMPPTCASHESFLETPTP
eukprot:70020-Amphidinium_carterae.2